VGGEHDGLARAGQRLDAGREGASGLHVHAHGGLVQEEDVGIPADREREVETLALAAESVPMRLVACSVSPAIAMARSAGSGAG